MEIIGIWRFQNCLPSFWIFNEALWHHRAFIKYANLNKWYSQYMYITFSVFVYFVSSLVIVNLLENATAFFQKEDFVQYFEI